MGQKMDPHGLRVGIIKDWDSKWYASKKDYDDNLVEDVAIRKYVKKNLFAAGVSRVEIERTAKSIKANVYTAKPGIALGKNGENVTKLRTDLAKMFKKDICLTCNIIMSITNDARSLHNNVIIIKNKIFLQYFDCIVI